ncbi:aldehyde dehydrogenase family protein [Rhodococcus opacus]|uniref:Aldehyde dehydrogenase family protein n=1 Tax=Rhodococcus opacus TaxID=37919 RepID=A0AAX3YS13_RHOOP|nr:aldehyde dehydrogenase family protein [Rhodococcus opacus]MCZ4585973.1 aldehyde dehydrogenase family protein [Rhodococcus opacus]WLF52071.1 aldehyde dehydrogenase family protein [Rhodococcus opacus]
MEAVVTTRWSSEKDEHRFEVLEPATGAVLARVAGAGPSEVDAAVAAAAAAQPRWAARSFAERGAILQRCAVVVRENATELARLESSEVGKPVSQAFEFDLRAAAAVFDYFGGALMSHTGGVRDSGPLLDVTEQHPYGVVASVIPFNWPPIHTGGKTAPALAMGNAMIIKPGEQAPLTVMRLVELISEVLPDDVLHVVPGRAETGASLVSHPTVRKISFTGAPGTGKIIAGEAAKNLVPTVMELGGKNAIVVLADADLDLATRWIVEGGFFNQGEACTASSRVLVHESVRAELEARIAAVVPRLVVGDGADPATHVGPLVTREQQQRVAEYLEVGKREGARVVAQAPLPDDPRLAAGFFVAPTVFTDVKPDMRIAQEEIFGPVVTITEFSTESEAVDIANGTDFGLVAGVFTRDQAAGTRVGRQLDAGVVFVNHYNRAMIGLPFGGVKHSGYGREHHLKTLQEWSYTKTLRLPSGTGAVPQWGAIAELFDAAGSTR